MIFVATQDQDSPRNKAISQLVSSYRKTFNELVITELELGLETQSGLKKQLNESASFVNDEFNRLSVISTGMANDLQHKSYWVYAIMVFVTIGLSLVLSYVMAHMMTKPITKLVRGMNSFMQRPDKEVELHITTKTEELVSLASTFVVLTQKVNEQFKEIDDKSQLTQRQNNELIKVNAELDRFVYSVAHDLRSPLTSLLGLVNLVKLELQNPSVNHYFEMMTKSIHKLDGFIKDIVSYSKNSRLELQPEELNMEEMVNSVIEANRYINSELKLDYRLKKNGSPMLLSDRRRVETILSNLITNAFRYWDAEKTVLNLSIGLAQAPQGMEISIADNGIGIANHHLDKIFKMFYRASENSQGTGLGLFIVKEAVEKIGGEIEVSSKLGVGTRFILRLPTLDQERIETLKLIGQQSPGLTVLV
ncbi:MAG: HAMP domain-containing histidine kinase [Cytophagales bacterium]|nr:HAMP domain-containing histidine kinase [Cytophagales bacterium]